MAEIKLKIKALEKLKAKEYEKQEAILNEEVSSWIVSKKIVTLKKDPSEITIAPKIEEKKVEEIVTIEKIDEDKGPIFENYDSDFYKNEKTIMEKVRNSRLIPKTRIWFVLSLISITILTVVLTMIFDSRHHSLESYKANIIWIAEKIKNLWKSNVDNETTTNNTSIENTPVTVVENQNPPIVTNTENTWSTNPPIENNISNTWWILFPTTNTENNISNSWVITTNVVNNNSWTTSQLPNTTTNNVEPTNNNLWTIEEQLLWVKAVESILPTWEKVYTYKWNTFTKEWLQEQLRKEIESTKTKKTRDYLNKLFIPNKN